MRGQKGERDEGAGASPDPSGDASALTSWLYPSDRPRPSTLDGVAGSVHALGPSEAVVVGHADAAAAGALGCAVSNTGIRPVLVVTADDASAHVAESAARFAAGMCGAELGMDRLGSNDTSPYADAMPDRQAAMLRTASLCRLARAETHVLVCPVSTLLRRVAPRAVLSDARIEVRVSTRFERGALLETLTSWGYLRSATVEDPGSFAIRGAVVDVWPAGRSGPLRIELDDDRVMRIFPFDPNTQKADSSSSELDQVELVPAREVVLTRERARDAEARASDLADALEIPTRLARQAIGDIADGRPAFGSDAWLPAYYPELDSILDYLGSSAGPPVVILVDPAGVARQIRDELERAHAAKDQLRDRLAFDVEALFLSAAELSDALSRSPLVATTTLETSGSPAAELPASVFSTAHHRLGATHYEEIRRAIFGMAPPPASDFSASARVLSALVDLGFTVTLGVRTVTQRERVRTLLDHHGLHADAGDLGVPIVRKPGVVIAARPLLRGFVLAADAIATISEQELFGRPSRARPKPRRVTHVDGLVDDIRHLKSGDLVVHRDHGVGRYLDLTHRSVEGHRIDLLCIEYAGGDKLYLPVHRLNQLSKYAGKQGASPRLDRLGGTTFTKSKAKARQAARDMADALLRLYAERHAATIEPLAPPDDDYHGFEASFPFEETDDQAKAIEDVGRDLECPNPTDRLICGDVGFGKTEVALRAAFRVAMAGHQVAVLCPTTVLAQQHFRTFSERFAGYPIRVRALNRFVRTDDAKATLSELRRGSADVVVGTHRLLSKDVKFADLGLLIVDEEQRFGVTHKERIKQLRATVHALTLTATPIPRTLQMAIGGLRELSLIATPPLDRRAVRTIIIHRDEQVIRDAIHREMARGGQVFYVYNRVEDIHARAAWLSTIAPEARIAVAHGQMAKGSRSRAEGALERVMLDFIDGQYDVLVATAIIESGLDIPRANTMFIEHAERLGLSQLYQMRGRVGRSKERGYCYLVVPALDELSPEARARLEAIERYTELGSGFRIASLDLELRGAGNLLGGEQSGHVESVGIEMFCRILDEVVREQRGLPPPPDLDPEVSSDIEALIPDDYVDDIGLRFAFYKRMASAETEDTVREIAAELEERFGPAPREVVALVELMVARTILRRLRVSSCDARKKSVTMHLLDDTPVEADRLLGAVATSKGRMRLSPDMTLVLRFDDERPGLAQLARAIEMLEALAPPA